VQGDLEIHEIKTGRQNDKMSGNYGNVGINI